MSHISRTFRARGCHNVIRAVALAGVVVAPSVALSAGPLATQPGQFSVSAGGAATYFIPIRVGLGLAGIAPSLGLAYHSQNADGEGLMGMAWSLSGLSSIVRCPKTVAQDGVRGSVNFSDDDRYCLDGQRLLLVSGTYGQDGAQYRTEIDNFSKVIGSGRAGNGTASFKVWTKSGTIQEFGTSIDARIEAVYAPDLAMIRAPDTVRVWALNKISDAKGNYLKVSYTKDAVNGVHSPARIDYAGNSVANTPPQSSVVFSYTAVSNPILKYHAGAISKRSTTLSEISTYYRSTTLLSKTKLTYENAGPTQTPRLTAVQSCDALGNCLLPLNMQYAIEKSGFSSVATSWPLPGNVSYQNITGSTSSGFNSTSYTSASLTDLNGDGLPDLYVTKNAYGNSPATATVYLNTGTGFSSTATSWPMQGNVPYQNTMGSTGGGAYQWSYTKTSLTDLNGDGLPDLYITANQYDRDIFNNVSPATQQVYLNTGTGFSSAATSWPLQGNALYQKTTGSICCDSQNGTVNARLTDLNGDGLPDLYTFNPDLSADVYGNSHKAYLNTNTGFSAIATSWPLPRNVYYIDTTGSTGDGDNKTNYTSSSLIDLNGDGLLDLYITKTGIDIDLDGNSHAAIPKVYLNTGAGFSSTSTSWPLQGKASYQHTTGSTGTGEYKIDYTSTSLTDLNGDGLPDLYITKSGYDIDADGVYSSATKVYLNKGTGFASTGTSWPLPGNASYQHTAGTTGIGDSQIGYTSASLTDLNGDGLPDLYITGVAKDVYGNSAPATQTVYFNESQPAHLLTQVSSTIGANTTITYGGLSDPAVYTKDSGDDAAVYPVVDTQSAARVVASVAYDNGIGGTNTINYSYGGLKKEVGTGRGSLGFRWTKSKNLSNGIEQYSQYRQDFPYAGMLAKSETRLAGSGNAGVLKRTTSTPACHIATSGTACTVTPGTIYYPYLASTLDQSWDLNGASTPSFTSSVQYNSFPHYGDPSQTSVISSDGIGKTTIFTYWPADIGNWILGRVKSSAVTSSNP